MSMFQNPEFLKLAQEFLATPSKEGSQYAGKFPDTEGFSKTPYGRGLLTNLVSRMKTQPRRKRSR